MSQPRITKLEIIQFEHKIADMGKDYNGFNSVYEKGSTLSSRPGVFRIHTSEGVVGEYLGGRVSSLDSVAGICSGRIRSTERRFTTT